MALPMTTSKLKPADYLKKILNARVYDVATESAFEPAKNLSRRLHNKVLLKREDQQPVFSFKLRGAYNKMVHLTPAQLARGVQYAWDFGGRALLPALPFAAWAAWRGRTWERSAALVASATRANAADAPPPRDVDAQRVLVTELDLHLAQGLEER